MRSDLRYLVDRVGPRLLVAAVVGCAVVGALVGVVVEAVHQYGLPLSPKGTPPS